MHSLSLKIDFVLAKSANPDKISRSVAFYQGNQCLPGTRFGLLSLQRVHYDGITNEGFSLTNVSTKFISVVVTEFTTQTFV